MRNLKQYPITPQEKIKVLTDLRDDLLKSKMVGDIRPAVLSEILKDLAPTKETA